MGRTTKIILTTVIVVAVMAVFFCLPARAATTESRSVGSKTAFSTGTISVSADGLTVTFTDNLSADMGKGDELTLDTGGTPEARYVLSKDSATQVTLQTASTKTGQSVLAFSIDEAYTSLNAWEAGEEQDLITNNVIAEVVCYPMTDSTEVEIAGTWSTSSENYIRIYTHPSFCHTGKWVDASLCYSHVLPVTDNINIYIQESYVRLEGLQIMNQYEDHFGRSVLLHGIGIGSGAINIDRCILKSNGSEACTSGIYTAFNASGAIVTVTNTLFYDFGFNLNSAGWMPVHSGFTAYFYNCMAQNTRNGFFADYDTTNTTVRNCVTVDCTNGFVGTFEAASDYNISDIADDAPGDNSINGVEPVFVDKDGNDFHLAATDTVARNAGEDLSGIFTDDIDGDTRSGWDIGPDDLISVTNVTSDKTNGTYTTGEVIDITVTFSDTVTVTGTPQLELETGTSDQIIDYLSGTGTVTLTFRYTVVAGDTSSDLDCTGMSAFSLNGGTIVDSNSHNVDLNLPSPAATGSLGANKALVIDTIGPTVSSVSSTEPNGTYSVVGEVLDITITFNEAVTVTGTPRLELETGAVDRIANYSGSTTTTLTFQYIVQSHDESKDLDYTGTGALTLNGGTITDVSSNDATLTLATPGAANSLGANKALVIAAPSAKAIASFVYDGDDDEINILMYLEKEGRQVVDSGSNTLKTGTVNIYSSLDEVTTMYTGNLAVPDANGNYWYTVLDAVDTYNFAAGKKYYVKLAINYGGVTESDNVTYQSSTSFDITTSKKAKELKTQIEAVDTALTSQASTVATAVSGEIGTDITSIKSDTSSIVTATGTTSLPDQISAVNTQVASNVKPHVKSSILNREKQVKPGETIPVKYQTETGLSPTVDVYAPSETLLVNDGVMVETGTSGIYTYDLTFDSSWDTGDYSIVCEESIYSTKDAYSIQLVEHSLQDIAGAATTILGTTTKQSKLTSAAEDITSQMGLLSLALAQINKNVSIQTEQTSAADTKIIYSQLSNISEEVKKWGVNAGLKVDLDEICKISEKESTDIIYLMNKIKELEALMSVSKNIIDEVTSEPVIQVWYELR
ncbi:MAG: hypothetical protein ABIH71_01190 [Candidatus Omnitrophota bacterium]|nr:hypothetical protein [Candidatus Omnitrophota bacterium]